MADAVTSRYIYPPDWDGNLPGDGETLGYSRHGWKKVILHLTNLSDSTGESRVLKLDLDSLRGPSGMPVVRTCIEEIVYANYGMGVKLMWERDTDITICLLPYDSGCIRGPMLDPGIGDGTDGTGNIYLTTLAAASNDSYDIKLTIKLKENSRDNAVGQ